MLFGLVLFCLMVEAPLLTFISALGTLKTLNFDLEIFSCYGQAPLSLPRIGSRPQAEATVACPLRWLLSWTEPVIQRRAPACPCGDYYKPHSHLDILFTQSHQLDKFNEIAATSVSAKISQLYLYYKWADHTILSK